MAIAINIHQSHAKILTIRNYEGGRKKIFLHGIRVESPTYMYLSIYEFFMSLNSFYYHYRFIVHVIPASLRFHTCLTLLLLSMLLNTSAVAERR